MNVNQQKSFLFNDNKYNKDNFYVCCTSIDNVKIVNNENVTIIYAMDHFFVYLVVSQIDN